MDRFLRYTTQREPALTASFLAAVLLAIVARYLNLTDEDLAILGPMALILAGVVIRAGVFSPATVGGLLDDEDRARGFLTVAHPCPGCLRVTSRAGRCVACGGGTTTERGYGSDWRRRRARQLLRNPTCQWMPAAGARACGRPATDVDHVVPKVHGGGDEPANLQSLCAAHHRRKTATRDRRWGTHIA